MKNICFFSGDITRSGGTEKVACQIANGLCKTHNVCFVSLCEKTDMFYELNNSITHEALFDENPDGIRQYAAIVSRLRKYIKKHNIDILIDVDTILDMFSVPAVKFTKTKLIAWEHFNFEETMGNPLRVPIRKHMTKRAEKIVTLTKEDRETYINKLKCPEKIEQIYNPIKISKSDMPYNTNSKTIISVGRLANQKGFDIMLDVAEKVFEKHPDWEWIVLGNGDDYEMLDKKRKEKNLNQVKFLGRKENVSDFLEKSAIYAMTSRYEGFPLVLIEAKAKNLPVVSFSCKTGPSELIEDGVNGYLINCFDVCDMADKICALIENAELRKQFSDKALLDTEKMDYEMIINEWKNLIEKV